MRFICLKDKQIKRKAVQFVFVVGQICIRPQTMDVQAGPENEQKKNSTAGQSPPTQAGVVIRDVSGDVVIAGDVVGGDKIVHVYSPDQRNQRILLKKVKEFWIDGVLESVLSGAVPIDIEEQIESEAVAAALPWQIIVRVSEQSAETRSPIFVYQGELDLGRVGTQLLFVAQIVAFGIVGGVLVGLGLAFTHARSLSKPNANQAPETNRTRRKLPIRGVFAGLVFGALGGFFPGRIVTLNQDVTFGIMAGVFFAIIFGELGGTLFQIIFNLNAIDSLRTDVEAIDRLSWSFRNALKAALRGTLGGFVAGTAIGGITWLGIEDVPVLQLPVPLAIVAVLMALAISGVFFGMIGGLISAVFGGLRGGSIEESTPANQFVRRSIRNALFASVIIASILGVGIGLITGFFRALIFVFSGAAVAQALFVGGTVGVLSGLVFSFGIAFSTTLHYGGFAIFKHVVLRLLLYQSGSIPLYFARFIDFTVERILLRRAGNGYIFVHRLLLSHIAALTDAEIDALA